MTIKIIATIGPTSEDKIPRLIENGMNIARINTKYGNIKQYEKIISSLKKNNCEILIDIKSKKILDWVNTQKIDYLAISFADGVRKIRSIKKLIHDKSVKIISKIENQKGINNVDSIIDESDGIMLGRGDLGRNISYEKVPIVQKIIMKKCHKKNRFDITATEMLMSMVNSKTPTNAEVSDVANAILDGSDALMLSEETAIGKYPGLSVKVMKKIIDEIEKNKKKLK
ncbi:MAG TPA: pyruvate kinase [Candidatus Nanoarchaeia archaeon]|nr:pyruvate kinase [Candidatus Nanoarchaeia archaeon]